MKHFWYEKLHMKIRLVQPDSEDFLSTIRVKMPQNNLPALTQMCYYFLFKHNRMQAESYTRGIENVFLWKWFTFVEVVMETKLKVLPERNVTPFTDVWEALYCGCILIKKQWRVFRRLIVCLCLTSVALWTTQSIGWVSVAEMVGLVCSGVHLKKIRAGWWYRSVTNYYKI